MNQKIIVPPDPTRLIEGLRDTGYDFNTAVADLIDNSIAADATIIKVWIEMDYGGEVILSIVDDGIGIDELGLIDAMKYGSPARPNKRSLGKFGLGMKTASTAFCRELVVISRPVDDDEVYKATWDLDHVAEVGQWELLIEPANTEEIQLLDRVAGHKNGTLVRWLKVDRLLREYSDPGGRFAREALRRKVNALKDHVAMIYQRFLNKDDSREPQKIQIWINDQEVKAWDPFCEGISELVAQETVPVSHEDNDDILGEFTVRAFVLPRREEFPDEELAVEARINNDNQGIYIYRENRLIHPADWMGLYSKEPHGSLLRVEFSFSAELDEALYIDIKKSRIALNETLYKWLGDRFLPAPRRAAQERYRKGMRKQTQDAADTAHTNSNRGIQNKEKDIDQAKVRVVNLESDEVTVTNEYGTTRLRLKLVSAIRPGEVFVQAVSSITDGLLWQPALIDGHQGVQLNSGHEFYRKVYLPNIQGNNGSVLNVQAFDYLLWAFSLAELKAISDTTKLHFEDMRFEISKNLRKLAELLPEPSEE